MSSDIHVMGTCPTRMALLSRWGMRKRAARGRTAAETQATHGHPVIGRGNGAVRETSGYLQWALRRQWCDGTGEGQPQSLVQRNWYT